MVTTVTLPDDLWMSSKEKALRDGISLSELVRRSLRVATGAGIEHRAVTPEASLEAIVQSGLVTRGMPSKPTTIVEDHRPILPPSPAYVEESVNDLAEDWEFTPAPDTSPKHRPTAHQGKSKFATASKLLPRDGK